MLKLPDLFIKKAQEKKIPPENTQWNVYADKVTIESSILEWINFVEPSSSCQDETNTGEKKPYIQTPKGNGHFDELIRRSTLGFL